jgi:hypothetical protein
VLPDVGSGSTAGAVPSVLTGPGGFFVLTAMPAGHFTLTAEFPGYLPGVFGRRRIDGPGIRLELGDRERRGDVVIRMWKDAAIAGRVLDEAGEPLVGLTVQAMRRSDREDESA